MLDWLAQTPTLLVAVAIVFLPGLLALWGVGVRGLGLLAAAPIFSVAATGVVALALGMLGVGWSAWSWAVAMLLLAGASFIVGRVLGGRLAPLRADAGRWILPVSLVVGVLLGVWRLATYITDPAGISQTNDAVFHMNAVRFILETADASSLHVNGVIGGSSFYPAAWHGLVSLVVLIGGASIPVAANMLTLVIGALIWPIGIAWLTRTITGSPLIAGVSAVLSGALQTFPLLMFQWGVLFPNALSTALLPAAVASMISLPEWRDGGGRGKTTVRAMLLAVVTACALALAQPAALLPWTALVLVWLTARLVQAANAWSPVRRWSIIVGMWIVFAVFWVALSRSTSGSHWPPFRGKLEVFLDVLLNGHLRIPFAVGVSVLMIWGLVVAWRSRRLRWLVFGWAGISALYLLVAAIGAPLVRVYILGAWYADPYRIAALAPLVVIPLAAVGMHDLVVRAGNVIRRRTGGAPGAFGGDALAVSALAAATVFMVVLVLVRPVAMPAVIEGTFDRESRYLAVSDSYLSPDERTLLESLDGIVGADARVIANPSTGAGFGYMLSGVDVYPRTWSAPRTETWTVLAEGLRDAASDPAVCEALHEYGDPQYVLDFGAGENTPGRFEMPGMTDFAGEPGFERVVEVGEVSLWRITACAR
ncbi:DUF6541 family protein [Microbacterium sp. NPDC028030]|uniref:DUF6541 family protein n=1 Tax=Microbacterium sp. NPDC028030 TaxID=3155124 RepID=UPI0033F10B44